jgi:hypothetical protein
MTRLIVLGFAAVALLGATTIWRSHSIAGSHAAQTAAKVSETHEATDSSKLPIQEFDDYSLVYPNRIR